MEPAEERELEMNEIIACTISSITLTMPLAMDEKIEKKEFKTPWPAGARADLSYMTAYMMVSIMAAAIRYKISSTAREELFGFTASM